MPCQVVILCGGMGSRLGNLTKSTPKPLLDIGGQTFLDFLMKDLCRFGFSSILLLAGYEGNKIYDRFHNKKILGVPIEVQVCAHQNGTGGDLLDHLNILDDDFLIVNGDSWVDTNYLNFYQFVLRQKRAEVCEGSILLKSDPEYRRYGAVQVEGLKVKAFLEKVDLKPQLDTNLINTGIYYFSKKLLLTYRRSSEKVSLERDMIPYFVEREEIGYQVLPNETFFIDIGIPETFRYACAFLNKHSTRPAIFFDRDNTLVFDSGYNHDASNIQWVPGAKHLIKALNDAGCYVFIITNQGGVAKGFYTEATVDIFHETMQRQLQMIGAHIDEFKYCVHHQDINLDGKKVDCCRRKPNPGMLTEIINDWPINAKKSLVIGDKHTDVLAGKCIGLTGLLINNSSRSLFEHVLEICGELNVFK